jgi:hypothetical protein
MKDEPCFIDFGEGRLGRIRRCGWLSMFVIGLMFLSSCGYRVTGGTAVLPGGVETIGVQVLDNRTAVSGLEAIVTNALVDEFTRRRPNMVEDVGRADAVLSGSIDSVTTDTVARSGTLTALERRMVITVSLVLRNQKGQTLWTRRITAQETYLVQDQRLETEMSLRMAAALAARRVGEHAYERLTDAF